MWRSSKASRSTISLWRGWMPALILTFPQESTSIDLVTRLVQEAGLPHGKMCKLVDNLIEAGLILRLDRRRSPRYQITDSGLIFLTAFRHLMSLFRPAAEVGTREHQVPAGLPRNKLILPVAGCR